MKLLQDNGIAISMSENGDPLENAIAERINGTIKQEYLEHEAADTLAQAQVLLEQAVRLYNWERPHMSIGNLTPAQIHHGGKDVKTQRLWRNYYQQKTTFVKQYQDDDSNVNLLQD